jgi:tetratricopeptide (TPR) repeat protein
LNNKGVALSNLGLYNEAIKWYDKALEERPDDPSIIANKARILGIALDKYTDALKLINWNLKNNPEHKGLLCNKAEILEKMGYTKAAIPIKEKLQKLYSNNYKYGYFIKTDLIILLVNHLYKNYKIKLLCFYLLNIITEYI